MGILFWILIFLGVPVIFGAVVSAVLIIGSSLVIGDRAKRAPQLVERTVEGLAAGLAAGWLCDLFGREVTATVLISVLAVTWL